MIFFAATAPWAGFVMFLLGMMDLRMRMVALLFSFKVKPPRRTNGIGQWKIFYRVAMYAAFIICPAFMVASGGYFEAFNIKCPVRITPTPNTCNKFLPIDIQLKMAESRKYHQFKHETTAQYPLGPPPEVAYTYTPRGYVNATASGVCLRFFVL